MLSRGEEGQRWGLTFCEFLFNSVPGALLGGHYTSFLNLQINPGNVLSPCYRGMGMLNNLLKVT